MPSTFSRRPWLSILAVLLLAATACRGGNGPLAERPREAEQTATVGRAANPAAAGTAGGPTVAAAATGAANASSAPAAAVPSAYQALSDNLQQQLSNLTSVTPA